MSNIDGKNVNFMSRECDVINNNRLFFYYLAEFKKIYKTVFNVDYDAILKNRDIEGLILFVVCDDGMSFTLNNEVLPTAKIIYAMNQFLDIMKRNIVLSNLGVDSQMVYDINVKESNEIYNKLKKEKENLK